MLNEVEVTYTCGHTVTMRLDLMNKWVRERAIMAYERNSKKYACWKCTAGR